MALIWYIEYQIAVISPSELLHSSASWLHSEPNESVNLYSGELISGRIRYLIILIYLPNSSDIVCLDMKVSKKKTQTAIYFLSFAGVKPLILV